jgi:hypothetical protein
VTDAESVDNGDSPRCSRAGCESPAVWNVNWRNPRIHTPDRVKVWLACDDHADFLRDYLATRDFPVIVTPLAESVDSVPDDPGRSS